MDHPVVAADVKPAFLRHVDGLNRLGGQPLEWQWIVAERAENLFRYKEQRTAECVVQLQHVVRHRGQVDGRIRIQYRVTALEVRELPDLIDAERGNRPGVLDFL